MGGPGAANGANEYGTIQKYISLQQGTTISSWVDRGSVATFAAMTPCGDGTYFYKANLFPGVVYNYMFFATVGGTAPAGLTADTTYYDCPRSDGDDAAFFVAIDSNNPNGTRTAGKAWFANAAGSDSRRIIQVPSNTGYTLASTSGVWVYNNWSSTPVATVSASPVSNTAIDVLVGAHSTWGTQESYKAIDVYAGGKWFLYKSTDMGGLYKLVASSTAVQLGSEMTYHDQSLTAGVTYYYVLVASDAYKGGMNAAAADGCLVTQLANGTTAPAANDTPATLTADAAARPATAIPVYFKVEAPDWDYISKNGNVVYLTPAECDGRFYQHKIPAVVTRAYLPN
jgi:hypothetical protein